MRAVRRLVAAFALAGAAAACAEPAPIPPPPAPLHEVKAPPDLILADSAIFDLRIELDRAHRGATPSEHFFMTKGPVAYAPVRAYYAERLRGWRALPDFPTHTRMAQSAVWRAGARTFAFALIADPDPARPRGEETLLVTLGPEP
jgi:hypothetical protein